MKLSTFLAPLTFCAWGAQAWSCLSDADAQSIVDRSIIFLSHSDVDLANQTAQGLFADNILEYGDSINSLRGDALGTVVESGKQSYIADTLSAPGVPSITTLAIIHACTQMVWQWEFNGIGPQRVRGVTIITVDADNKVSQQYVEFNSLAWAIDIGFNVTPPANGPFSR